MIIFSKKDIFSQEVDAIVNPVNTIGISGKGLALEFRKRYPANYQEYRRICKEKKFNIGDI
jgi:O-acetyl-ADP-ribose deacetylase (regulator of RNase III)